MTLKNLNQFRINRLKYVLERKL